MFGATMTWLQMTQHRPTRVRKTKNVCLLLIFFAPPAASPLLSLSASGTVFERNKHDILIFVFSGSVTDTFYTIYVHRRTADEGRQISWDGSSRVKQPRAGHNKCGNCKSREVKSRVADIWGREELGVATTVAAKRSGWPKPGEYFWLLRFYLFSDTFSAFALCRKRRLKPTSWGK